MKVYPFVCSQASLVFTFCLLSQLHVEAGDWRRRGSPGSIHHVNDVRWMGRGPTAMQWIIHPFYSFWLLRSSLLSLVRTYLNISSSPPPHPPGIHSCGECSQAFPVFHWSSALVYYCEYKRKVKTGEAWEQGCRYVIYWISWYIVKVWYVDSKKHFTTLGCCTTHMCSPG